MEDSGKRDVYNGGAVRDKRDGKGRYDLISPIALFRLARVYEDGAKGKGERNWEEGISLGRFVDSAIRHLEQFRAGMRNEDHLAQAAWNIFGKIHTEDQIARGNLPAELNDLPEAYVDGDGFVDWEKLYGHEEKPKRKIRIYAAASVRGPNGDDATPETMAENIKAGVAKVEYLRENMTDCEIYSPHEHERLFQEPFQNGMVKSKHILDQCFGILRLCDAVIICTPPDESEGVKAEIQEAIDNGIPVIGLWNDPEHKWPEIIKQAIEELL